MRTLNEPPSAKGEFASRPKDVTKDGRPLKSPASLGSRSGETKDKLFYHVHSQCCTSITENSGVELVSAHARCNARMTHAIESNSMLRSSFTSAGWILPRSYS
jgi:hypothetical protein